MEIVLGILKDLKRAKLGLVFERSVRSLKILERVGNISVFFISALKNLLGRARRGHRSLTIAKVPTLFCCKYSDRCLIIL